MPQAQTLEAFIAMVVRGEHVEAIENFYLPNASMQENLNPPRVGREVLMAHERRALSRATSVDSECVRPVFVHGDHVVIRWVFVFHRANGGSMRIEELAYQRWEGEKIAQEQFFYDPVQMQPPKTST
jgi:ketosteroid isomerase-like protein